jgi:hypothetical protein
VAPLVAMAVFVAPWAFLFILGHQAVRGLAKPILTQRILRHTYADKRATVLSLSALSGRLFFAVTAPIIGWYGESTSIPHSLLGQAVVLAALFGLLLAIYQQIPSKYFQVKSQPTEGSG